MSVIVIDFTGAPPAQGGAGLVHIPAGHYPLVLKECSKEISQAGNEMIVTTFEVESGQHAGTPLIERFVLTNDPKKNFGVRRFHALVLALKPGLQPQTGQVKLDTAKLVGLRVDGDICDKEVPAKDDYPASVASMIRGFYPYENGAAPASAPAAPQATAPTAPPPPPPPAPAPQPETVAETPAPAATTTAAPDLQSIADDVDDLFK